MRETREEVGVNLTGGGFEFAGRLDDREVKNGRLVISAFVFILKDEAETPALVLQEEEVADAWWVSLDQFEHYLDKTLPEKQCLVSDFFPANRSDRQVRAEVG